MVLQSLVNSIRQFLREERQESVWRTSQISGLRQETITRLENSTINGSASSLDDYITSFCRRFPAEAKSIFNSVILHSLGSN